MADIANDIATKIFKRFLMIVCISNKISFDYFHKGSSDYKSSSVPVMVWRLTGKYMNQFDQDIWRNTASLDRNNLSDLKYL